MRLLRGQTGMYHSSPSFAAIFRLCAACTPFVLLIWYLVFHISVPCRSVSSLMSALGHRNVIFSLWSITLFNGSTVHYLEDKVPVYCGNLTGFTGLIE